jgi:hypothetical protein
MRVVVNHLHFRDPVMRESIVPLLDRDTERSVGEVIASARA